MRDHGVHAAMSDILAANYAGHDLAIVSAAAGTLFELHVLPNVQIISIVIQVRPDMIDYLMRDGQNCIRPGLRQAFLTKQLLNKRIFVRLVRRSKRYISLISLLCIIIVYT